MADPVRYRRLTPADWPLVETLFGEKGACGGCWCMYWHAPPGEKAWQAAKGAANRAALKRLVESGECRAMIAVAAGEPVGWCRFGPRQSFERLARSRKIVTPDSADWAVVCFYISKPWRGRGVGTGLLRAATEEALAKGAASIEGYPVVTRTDPAPAPFVWTGLPSMFEAAGYRPVDVDAGSRKIYRFASTGSPQPR